MNINIPTDVSDYVRTHFRACNDTVSKELSNFPPTHEESLDMNFVSHFSRNQKPVKLLSDWVVRIDAHFIGGGRHFGTWEVADIAIIMIFRKKEKLIRSKIALLQSKKLYSSNVTYREDSRYIRRVGLGRYMTDEKTHREIIEPRTLIFKRNSKYKAYKKGSEQQSAMGHFERRWDTSLYYMFYNPFVIPHSINMPVIEHLDFVDNEVGCSPVCQPHPIHSLSGIT